MTGLPIERIRIKDEEGNFPTKDITSLSLPINIGFPYLSPEEESKYESLN